MQNLQKIKHRLKQNPDDAQTRWQHGCALAFQGHWEAAWPELEWRFKGHRQSMLRRQQYSKPDWDGSNTKLLIYQDQGSGDLFQHVRYVRELKCDYILEVAPELYNLMKFQKFNVMLRGNPLPEYDQVCAVCSLPYHFKRIIAPHAYLNAPSGNFHLSNKRKIGIAWAGNPDYFDDGHRSCDPKEFLRLQDCGELVSLMIKKTDLPFTDYSLNIKDFADTAEIISQLDCVVTVDTAVGHLAAALGKTVYLALSYEHDWRWMADCKDTIWYPTMKLFRQPKRGDWESVFTEIKKVLI